MNTKAVIFDKDGTLLDFDSYWVNISEYALKDILKKFNAEHIPLSEIMSELGVVDNITEITGYLCCGTYTQMSESIHKVLKKYNCSADFHDVVSATIDAYHSNSDKGTVLPACSNIDEVLAHLKKLGLKLAVVTTDDYYGTKKHLDKLQITNFFDAIYTDDGKFPAKPDPYCINDFCKKEGLSKSQIVMVGDTLTDVNFAKNGGIDIIGVSKSSINTEILKKEIDVVVSDISCVAAVIQ